MDLEELLDKIKEAGDDESASLGDIVSEIGQRSFGPILLLAGLITLAPLIGDIPGMPTIMGILVLLVAVQLLVKRRHFWLPGWLLKRSFPRDKLDKGVEWVRPAARFLDRWLRPRLTSLVTGLGTRLIALVCAVIALAMPAMEVVPFSANGAGAALTAFGLAIVLKDGLVAAFALVITFTTLGIVGYNLIFG